MNEQTEMMEQLANTPIGVNDVPASARSPEVRTGAVITPQGGGESCGCGGAAGLSTKGSGVVSYVYAIGRVEARFPNLAAEKEFAQATGRTETAGKTDQQTFHAVLSVTGYPPLPARILAFRGLCDKIRLMCKDMP
jgi:hypothetical protein